jgi:hypothetical protein
MNLVQAPRQLALRATCTCMMARQMKRHQIHGYYLSTIINRILQLFLAPVTANKQAAEHTATADQPLFFFLRLTGREEQIGIRDPPMKNVCRMG